MRNLIFLAVACLIASPVSGQDKRAAKDGVNTRYLRDHAETRGFMLGRPVKPLPTPDGKAVLFLRSPARQAKLSLFEFDLDTGKTRVLLTPEQVLKGAEEKLSPEEKARRERMRVSVGGLTGFQLSDDGKQILLSLSGKLYLVNRDGGGIRELPTGPGTLLDPKFAPDSKKVSYVRNFDVHVLDLESGKERAVTRGGTVLISHGLAEFVAQEEMGRFTGYWWSPDSKFIAYQETDARGVEVWHVADPIEPAARPHESFYPRPGKANVKVRVGIVPAGGGDTTWLSWDAEQYPYLTTVRWAEQGPLLLGVQTRDQTELMVLQADPATGKTTRLLSETDPAWVNIHQDAPRWLKDGGFLWISERDGGPQLEMRAVNGRLKRVLVPAWHGFQELVEVVPERKELYFSASVDPTESHFFRMSLLSPFDEPEQITKIPGLYAASFGKNHALYTLTARTMDAMPQTYVYRADGTRVGKLPSVAEEPPLEPNVELVRVGPGSGLHAAVILPSDFNPRKKYPVLVDVYGGPHHIHVLATKNRWLLDQWYADQGFIVVAIDGRGTPGRGRDWERAIYKKFASLPLEDQVAGLKALAERYPAMDLDRVGISGWSFGGYMAALAVLRRPDIFKAGVAGAPVVDWLDYDTHYTERYLGIPPKDDAAYKEANLLTYAADLKRPLLIMHGTADDNVYFRHSLKLVNALFRAGKDFEVLPLSGLTHMVPDPVVMERLHGRISRFLHKHLGGPK
jgi:dipeptidyl-peptidase-4